MTHDRGTVSNFGKEAQAEDRGTKITGVPVDCIIGSAWIFSFTGTIEPWLPRTHSGNSLLQLLQLSSQTLRQLTWWVQYGTTLRPAPCSWQYFLQGLVIVSHGTTATPFPITSTNATTSTPSGGRSINIFWLGQWFSTLELGCSQWVAW